MVERDPLWRRLLRYASFVLLAAPLAGLAVVWAAVSVLSLTPDRRQYLAIGDRIMVGLVVLAGVGLLAEFVIVPLILAERQRCRVRDTPDEAKTPPGA
ncbi:MAG: hypothetical protein GC145_05880 [Caulobacter sp.]|nr:hypothetical protein [Caulobacter sp.]